jgi:aminoglycoside 3-N-acetyltransferase
MEKNIPKKPMYITDEGLLYPYDFSQALKNVGVVKGDIILVHSDISVFGKLVSNNRGFLFSSLINVLKDAVTEDGLIIMPTFSYSFCNNCVFDPEKTKSKVGVLTDFFRTQPGVVRTVHPIFSFALWGKRSESFLSISKDSFDKDSIFGKIYHNLGKIVFLGAPFQSCTFIHYIEQMHGVPYRFMKTFKGVLRNSDKEYHDEYTYFVQYLDRDVTLDLTRLEKHLMCKNLLKKETVGNGNILYIDTERLFSEGSKLLDMDIRFFLREDKNEMPLL